MLRVDGDGGLEAIKTELAHGVHGPEPLAVFRASQCHELVVEEVDSVMRQNVRLFRTCVEHLENSGIARNGVELHQKAGVGVHDDEQRLTPVPDRGEHPFRGILIVLAEPQRVLGQLDHDVVSPTTRCRDRYALPKLDLGPP